MVFPDQAVGKQAVGSCDKRVAGGKNSRKVLPEPETIFATNLV
jgi:hypothetical protein